MSRNSVSFKKKIISISQGAGERDSLKTTQEISFLRSEGEKILITFKLVTLYITLASDNGRLGISDYLSRSAENWTKNTKNPTYS